MSNQVYIKPCEFKDVRSGECSKGFRAYDDYEKTYCNFWENIPDDDLEILAQVLKECDNDVRLNSLLSYIQEQELGIIIGGVYYEWEQIKHLFPV